jgi:hypothetical protein
MVRVTIPAGLMGILAALLTGCGQVIVFGHGMGERRAPTPPPDTTAQSAASDATVADTRPASAAAAPVAHVVKSVNLIVTSEVASQATGEASRLSADALLDAIKTELKSRKLLDEQNPQASGTAEIVVDDLAIRPTTSSIPFGYKMLAGTLEGEIRVTGSRDVDSTGSRIVAQSKVTVAANGEDLNPLGPLYRRFAVLAADRLAGATSPPPDPTGVLRF